jgi:hypothetical protein
MRLPARTRPLFRMVLLELVFIRKGYVSSAKRRNSNIRS